MRKSALSQRGQCPFREADRADDYGSRVGIECHGPSEMTAGVLGTEGDTGTLEFFFDRLHVPLTDFQTGPCAGVRAGDGENLCATDDGGLDPLQSPTVPGDLGEGMGDCGVSAFTGQGVEHGAARRRQSDGQDNVNKDSQAEMGFMEAQADTRAEADGLQACLCRTA